MKNDLLKHHNAGFNACWQYYKKFATAENFNTDEFWHEVIVEMDRLAKAYDSTFINRLIFAVVDELEHQAREERYAKAI